MKKTIQLLVVCACYFLISCTSYKKTNTKFEKQEEYGLLKFATLEMEVLKIDTTQNAFFIENKADTLHFTLASWKTSKKCKNKIEEGRKYTMNIRFETFMAGEYDSFMIDGKEFLIDKTLLAFTKDLKGLCLINNPPVRLNFRSSKANENYYFDLIDDK